MQLNLDIDKWNTIAGNIGSICSDNWNQNYDGIEIIERIGSDSSQGEVYKLKINDFVFAGKILPIISDKSFEDNQNEISIAKQLSQEVKNNNTIYFPIVYDSTFCEKTTFNSKSLFYEDSYKYALYNWLCKKENMNSACKKRMINKYKNMNVKEIKNLHPDFNDINISSHVLMSELCFSDLRQFSIKYNKNESFWISIISHIFEAIKYLNENMNIIHDDLHTGNILLRLSKNETDDCYTYYPLIHDFGKSRKNDCWSMYDRITDVGKFLYDLKINPNIPDKIKIKCDKLFVFIDEIKNDLVSRPIMQEIIHKFLFVF
jgi:virulence-associated protein VapD